MIQFIYFIADFVVRTNWVFYPLFLVGFLAWYYVVEAWWSFKKNYQYNQLGKKFDSFWDDFISSLGAEANSKKLVVKDFEIFLDNFFKKWHRGIHSTIVLTGVALLLGLFGTVNGMINTFEVISLYGNNNPTLMVVGISEAMLTTQMGLLISLPLMVAVLIIRNKLKNIKLILMDTFLKKLRRLEDFTRS